MTAADVTAPALLLDMDGVILRGRQTAQSVYDRAAERAIETLGLSVTDAQRATLSAFDLDPFLATCSALDVDAERVWGLREEYATAIATERIETGERTTYDDVAALEDVAASRPLGLVSNNRHDTVAFVAEHFGLPVATVRGRDPTIAGFRRRKPDPHYLTESLAALDTEAGLYVGDRASDVEAAERAGLDSAYLRREHNATDQVPPAATHEIDSLAELPRIVERD